LAIAAQCGATGTFNGTAADARDFVSEHTEGNLADVVYDVTGNWKVFPTALPLARDFGRTVVLGDSPEPSKQHLSQDILTRQVTVIGTHNARLQPQYAHWTRDRQIALFYEYIKRGSFHLDDLITHRYQPDEAAQVYRQLLHNRSGTLGALFDWRLS
jgi:threonine dehydrogenase-like Zn-dependent dehydrogenase